MVLQQTAVTVGLARHRLFPVRRLLMLVAVAAVLTSLPHLLLLGREVLAVERTEVEMLVDRLRQQTRAVVAVEQAGIFRNQAAQAAAASSFSR